MFERVDIERIINYQKQSKNGYWPCLYSNCNARAINSHIVQRNRYLKLIATDDNKVFVHETNFFKDPLTVFKQRGINQVLSFPGFCEKHDDTIFSSIEKRPIDFKNWRHIHLLCYRTELNERRKKEIVIKMHEFVLSDKKLRGKIDTLHRSSLIEHISGNREGIQDSRKTITDIVGDLNSNFPTCFEHFSLEMPRTGVCICGVFNLETTADQQYRIRLTGKPYDYLSPIFIHLVPINKETDSLTITYEKGKKERVKNYLKHIFGTSQQERLKQLSDLLFLQVENWICSKDFYIKNIKSRENYVVTMIERTMEVWDENAPMEFNVFEN